MIGYSTVTQKGQVTIPVSIRQFAGIAVRQRVMIAADQDGVKIKPAPDIMSLYGSVAPRSRPENFPAMRKKFINYLSTRHVKK